MTGGFFNDNGVGIFMSEDSDKNGAGNICSPCYHQVSFEQTSEVYAVGGPSDDVLPSVSVNNSKSGAFISETNCAGHVGGVEKFVGSTQ